MSPCGSCTPPLSSIHQQRTRINQYIILIKVTRHNLTSHDNVILTIGRGRVPMKAPCPPLTHVMKIPIEGLLPRLDRLVLVRSCIDNIDFVWFSTILNTCTVPRNPRHSHYCTYCIIYTTDMYRLLFVQDQKYIEHPEWKTTTIYMHRYRPARILRSLGAAAIYTKRRTRQTFYRICIAKVET